MATRPIEQFGPNYHLGPSVRTIGNLPVDLAYKPGSIDELAIALGQVSVLALATLRVCFLTPVP